MATTNELKTLYEEELGDLWSANDQMQRIVAKMAENRCYRLDIRTKP